MSVVFSRLRRSLRVPLSTRFAYAAYAWTVFFVLALSAVVGVLLVPSVAGRRRLVRGVARTCLRAVGLELSVRGLELLPAGQCVVVANHASYLDGVVLKAALPARFAFVIKREMSAVPLAGLLLRRIGSEFVDRSGRQRAATDARRVLRAAGSGHSLVFFPEGTFTRTPGLGKFHTGAFVTAARARCPVVPIVVRGTRRALPTGSLLPRPGRIELEVLGPLDTAGAERDPVVWVCAAARSAILSQLGEPDLSSELANAPLARVAR